MQALQQKLHGSESAVGVLEAKVEQLEAQKKLAAAKTKKDLEAAKKRASVDATLFRERHLDCVTGAHEPQKATDTERSDRAERERGLQHLAHRFRLLLPTSRRCARC